MKLKNITLLLSRLMLDSNNYRLDYDRDLKIYEESEIFIEQEAILKRLMKEK